MFSTVFNAATVYILNDAWDAKQGDFQLDGTIIRDEQESLTKRSARRPYSQTLLSKCKFSVTLQDEDVRAVLGSLRTMTTENVVLPLWPAMQRWADRASSNVSGGLLIVFKKDWSQYAIYTTVEPGWPAADDLWCPALMGFISPTQPKMRTPDAANWEIDFTESSDAAYALTFNAAAAAAGPEPVGYASAPKLLPLQPDFQEVVEQVSVEVKRDQIGFTRDQSETFYPQAAQRLQRASYTLTDEDIWTMLQFFTQVMGPGNSFWAPTWLEAGRIAADIHSADDTITVENPDAVRIGDFLAFFTHSVVATTKVTNIVADVLSLWDPVGIDLAAANTLLLQLCLARLSQPAISMTWKRPGAAKCTLQWEELPPEYVIPGDETLAGTIGKLPIRVVLFQFTRDLGVGGILTFYYTNFEKTLNWSGQDWASGNFQIGDISRSLNLEEDTIEIDSFIFAGNPFNDDLALRAEAPMTVIVRFADYDGAVLSNVQTVFSGDAAAPSRQGSKMTIRCKFGPSLLDTQLPRQIRGVSCNRLNGANDGTHLISVGCTGPDAIMLKANWKFTGLVVAPVSSAFPFALKLNTLTGVGANAAASLAGGKVFVNWFANGWVEWGGAAALQRRLILQSTLPAAGVITLTLHRYFGALPAIGDTITFYPGCDGLPGTCKAYDASTNPTGKFNNFLNFGGEPFTPIANPSTVGQPNLNTRGAKK